MRRRNCQKIQSFTVILPQPFTSNILFTFLLFALFVVSLIPSLPSIKGIFSFIYSTNQGIDNAVPVLLVDGYNVCGYWPKLKKHFIKGRLDVARLKLIEELVEFSMIRGLYFLSLFYSIRGFSVCCNRLNVMLPCLAITK